MAEDVVSMPTADRMKRRDFIALLLGGTTTAWPLAARGQSMPVIGFLAGGLANAATVPVAGFRQGLRKPATSRAKTSISRFDGRKDATSDFPNWQPNW
jgi:hypothetical protein